MTIRARLAAFFLALFGCVLWVGILKTQSQVPSVARWGIPILPTAAIERIPQTPTPSGFENQGRNDVSDINPQPGASVDFETDLSPSLSQDNKSYIVVQHNNGRREGIWVDPDNDGQASEYINRLRGRALLVTIIPPAASMGNLPNPLSRDESHGDVLIPGVEGAPVPEDPPLPE